VSRPQKNKTTNEPNPPSDTAAAAPNTAASSKGVGTDKEREELLALIWATTARAMLAELSKAEPTAASLQAARAFLSDNGVSVSSLRSMGGAVLSKELMDSLPVFHKDETED
jgi:hypothetical protein